MNNKNKNDYVNSVIMSEEENLVIERCFCRQNNKIYMISIKDILTKNVPIAGVRVEYKQ